MAPTPPDAADAPVPPLLRLLGLAVVATVPLLFLSCLASSLMLVQLSSWAMPNEPGDWYEPLCRVPSLGEAAALLGGAATLGLLVGWWYRGIFAAYLVPLRPLAWAALYVGACAVWVAAYGASACLELSGGLETLRIALALALFAILSSAFARPAFRVRVLAMWFTALAVLALVVWRLGDLMGD